ncbi:hypothetical protein DFH08DRAFT_957907 [Mycena albidolilacea]|uniref:Uncharacterized protein n=1 Tax=Mycena albidolilacea TaxID=1033008 RepID=A0AAD7EV16_9AGAR|nr:hypothetical protein DFH08DRAFT_957907 [Mycena albidolilacea]
MALASLFSWIHALRPKESEPSLPYFRANISHPLIHHRWHWRRLIVSSSHPSILGPCRSNPVVLHASVSRAAWNMTCAYSAIPSSHRLPYTPLSSFQRPPICARPRAPAYRSRLDRRPSPSARILARMDAHDLHARLSVPPNVPSAAALFSISSSSTFSFARSHPTRIAGRVLLHAHGDLPPFPVRDATRVRPVYAHSTGMSTGYEGVRGRIWILTR